MTMPNDGLSAAEFAELARLPPADAMRWMQQRGHAALSYSWQDLWQEEHSRYFTISRLARLDLLQSICQSMSQSVAGDMTRRDWLRDTEALLTKAGWYGKKEVVDPATGKTVTTTFNPARLQLIYDTNSRQASARGQWERIQRARASHPYLRYDTMEDDRVRPLHAAWNRVTLPVDHPFWQTHYPPCGYRCRCRVRALNQQDYEQGTAPDGATLIKTAPHVEMVDFTNHRTGEITQTPAGVDPGFGNIPAQAARLEKLDELVRAKLESGDRLIANAAQYEGLTLESAAATYAEKARLVPPGNAAKMPPLPLAPIANAALAQLEALDLPIGKKALALKDKRLGLEQDGVRHVFIQHGGDSEQLRGQVPITAGDIAAFPKIFNLASIERAERPEIGGAPMVTGKAVFGEFRYEFAARVERSLIVIYSLYKWAIK